MYYLIVLLVFLALLSFATLFVSIKKIILQYNIKKKRIESLINSDLSKDDIFLTNSLIELYTTCFSHYFTYCIGHFSSILINTYSIILSVVSLSMISFEEIDEITRIISLLSTLFIITLVFSRLDERSSLQFSNWNQCENIIIEVSDLISNSNEINSKREDIFSIIKQNKQKSAPF